MVVGRETKLPSGKVYSLPWCCRRTIEVEDEDVPFLLQFKGECCTGGRGKTPLFELA